MTFLRDHWYPVAVAGTTTTPVTIRLLGDEYVLWPTSDDGGFALSEPFCPHRSAHLAGGWVEDGHLVCPYHGWRFDGSGACTFIPQMDDDLPVPPKASLRTFPAVARYGMVWVCIGEQPVSPEPPVWREAVDHPDWRFHVEFFERWNVAAPRIIDNNLDASHVAFVHKSTFGDPADAHLPNMTIEPTPTGGFVTTIRTVHRGVGLQNGVTDDESARLHRESNSELLAPLITRTRLRYSGASPDYCFFGGATPIDDRSSMYLRITALSGSEAEQPWEKFHAFGTRVKEEDRVILESTVPDFPVDITSEVHLKCDRATLEYRKHLMSLVDAMAGSN